MESGDLPLSKLKRTGLAWMLVSAHFALDLQDLGSIPDFSDHIMPRFVHLAPASVFLCSWEYAARFPMSSSFSLRALNGRDAP